MTKNEIIKELKQRSQRAKEDLEKSKFDIHTPGFNQNLGRHDALGEFLEWIEDNDF